MQKIPVIGVENAGKSSLILTFQRQFRGLARIKPTKKIKRTSITFLDKEINVWDFGGQEKYRERYLDRADIYFTDFDACFFVIDIQDQDLYRDALNYFKLIRTALLEYQPDACLNILIHKFDPGMQDDASLEKLASSMEQKVREIAKPLKTKLFRTSIFNPLSVLHAFSDAVVGNTVLRQNLKILIENFIDNFDWNNYVKYVIVYGDNLVEISSYFDKNVDQLALRDSSHQIFRVFENDEFNLNKADITLKNNTMDIQVVKSVDERKTFYVVLGYYRDQVPELSKFHEEFNELFNEIEKMLKFF